MQSTFKLTGLIKITSLVQILLALVGIYLLFDSQWGWYQMFNSYSSRYRYYTVWYNAPNNAAMWSLTAGFLVLFLAIAFFGLQWGWLSPGQTAIKYAKLTIVLGLLVLALSAVAAGVIMVQRSSLYPDAGNVSWGLSTALNSFLIGSVLFIIIGFIGTLVLRQAAATYTNAKNTTPMISRIQLEKLSSEMRV